MKSSNIGGQAVLEGIMMRNGGKYSVAVRKSDGEIAVDVQDYHSVIPWKTPAEDPVYPRHLQLHRFPCARDEDAHVFRQFL